MKAVNGLPHRVVGVETRPHWNLGQQEQEIHDEEDDSRTGDLSKEGCTILRARASLRFCHTK